ncbi:site-specific integrase [Echinicola marina]|uniref:tyrosine-type recombinase/integrase n=1 Tax=Echinicola marina TaxID=2859768 RepID=UPI001CF6F601|nr:site-specific integrase [Echinicola marina]UCS95295.1 site-specific integrase [Echinicola marina]
MSKQMTISEVITLWKTDKRQYVKKSSFSAYVLLIENHILPEFGNECQLSESMVQDFVFRKLAQGLSQKTVKDVLIVLKMILKFGVKNQWLRDSPLDIRFPTEREKHHIEVLSKFQQKKIMQHIEQHFTFRNLGIYICLSTGLRIGEVCALTWEDVDTDMGIIRVSKSIQRIYTIENGIRKTELILDTPKTKNSIREIPISRDLLRLLKPIKKIMNPAFFVLTNEQKPTEPRTYRSYYQKFMEELNMAGLKFHGLRHSFATRCIESNCDYKTVSVLLGHSNISTTLNLYVHPNMEQKKKAIDKMAMALK